MELTIRQEVLKTDHPLFFQQQVLLQQVIQQQVLQQQVLQQQVLQQQVLQQLMEVLQ